MLPQVTHPMVTKLTQEQVQAVKKIFSHLVSNPQMIEHLALKELTIFLNDSFSVFSRIDEFANSDFRLEKVLNKIKINYHSVLSVTELAATIELSKFHFIRLFKQCYHISPMKYLINCRINNAKKELLKDRKRSMAEIAIQNGFYDESHFDKLFKQYTGVSPKNFQQQVTSKVTDCRQND